MVADKFHLRNISRMRLLILLIVTLIPVTCSACRYNPVVRLNLKGGPQYFISFHCRKYRSLAAEVYYFFVIEEDKISYEEAIALKNDGYAYIEASFDDIGRIVVFKKHSPQGGMAWINNYTYALDGTLHRMERLLPDKKEVEIYDSAGALVERHVLEGEGLNSTKD